MLRTAFIRKQYQSIMERYCELDIQETFARKIGFYINDVILIKASLPNYKKLVIVFHELGHHICYKSKCKCSFGPQNLLSEVHAHKFCLNELIKNKHFSSLFFAMQIPLLWIWKCPQKRLFYRKAGHRILDSEIWHRGLEIIGRKTLNKWAQNKGINLCQF